MGQCREKKGVIVRGGATAVNVISPMHSETLAPNH